MDCIYILDKSLLLLDNLKEVFLNINGKWKRSQKIEKLVEIIKITSNSRRSVNDFNSDAFL